MIEIFLRARAKGQKDVTDFKSGTFVGRFPSDGAASIAVKGLNKSENVFVETIEGRAIIMHRRCVHSAVSNGDCTVALGPFGPI